MAQPKVIHPGQPVGVFDSGVGGLTVLREIRHELPAEDLLYVADSGHAPYGDKAPAAIEARALVVTEFLIAQGAKAVVVACNTATGAAARVLRSRYAVPVIAMEPAVKPAVSESRSRVVGVMATRATLASEKFQALIAQVRGLAEVLLQPCPGLVERIEAGDLAGEGTRAMVADYLAPLLERGADQVVLGCTHYPYLRPLIEDLAGPGVRVLDSGAAVARQVRRRLEATALLSPPGHQGRERFWTSGCPVAGVDLIARLWGAPLTLASLPQSGPAPAGGLNPDGRLRSRPDLSDQ